MNELALKILIADHDALARDSMASALTTLGHCCETAGDGRECLKKLAQKVYDLVFLDLVMPEMDGWHVMHAMRGRFPGTDVVIISAQDDEDTIQEMMSLGAVAYLIKPTDPSVYTNLTQQIAEQRQKRSTQAGIPKPAQS